MKCEICGREGRVFMIPMSKRYEGYVCDWCLDNNLQYIDDDEESMCDCCGEPVYDMFVEADGIVWCMRCIEETEEYERRKNNETA